MKDLSERLRAAQRKLYQGDRHEIPKNLASNTWEIEARLVDVPGNPPKRISSLSSSGPAQKRAPVRMLREADSQSEPKGYLCARYFTGQVGTFNLHAARRVAPNDKQEREMLCRYILRPPLANERLHLLADGSVTVEFKRPWSDGTRSIGFIPKYCSRAWRPWFHR